MIEKRLLNFINLTFCHLMEINDDMSISSEALISIHNWGVISYLAIGYTLFYDRIFETATFITKQVEIEPRQHFFKNFPCMHTKSWRNVSSHLVVACHEDMTAWNFSSLKCVSCHCDIALFKVIVYNYVSVPKLISADISLIKSQFLTI